MLIAPSWNKTRQVKRAGRTRGSSPHFTMRCQDDSEGLLPLGCLRHADPRMALYLPRDAMDALLPNVSQSHLEDSWPMKRPCTLWRPGALRRSQPVRIRDSAPDPRYCPSPGCELRRRRQALLPALRPVPRLRLPVRVLVVFPAVPGNHPHCSRRTGRCHHSCGSRDGLRGRSRWSASRQRPGSASVQCLRPCDPCTVPRRHGASSS